MKKVDLTGKVFGRWTVIGDSGERRNKKVVWSCVCQCGTHKMVVGSNMVNGNSKSCGCWDREVAAQRLTTHGDCSGGVTTKERTAYTHMLSRCYNQNSKQFHDYGGRGISVCDEWRSNDGYAKFLAHVGRKPSDEHSIDRIDVNGNYEPGNVRWATTAEQARNKRLHRDNTTGVSGISRRNGKWRSKITVGYRQINLCTTNDFFEACCSRKAAENQYWRAA